MKSSCTSRKEGRWGRCFTGRLWTVSDSICSWVECHRRNLDLYRGDIHKHAVDYERKVEAIFDEIPEQLGRHEKRFFLSSLGGGAHFREYESSFFLGLTIP